MDGALHKVISVNQEVGDAKLTHGKDECICHGSLVIIFCYFVGGVIQCILKIKILSLPGL